MQLAKLNGLTQAEMYRVNGQLVAEPSPIFMASYTSDFDDDVNGIVGTAQGGTYIYTGANKTPFATGAQQSVFGGDAGDAVTYPASTSWDIGDDEFTAEAWVFAVGSAAIAKVIFTNCALVANTGWVLYQYGTQLTGGVGAVAAGAATGLTTLAWHHVALVRRYDGATSKIRIYRDGIGGTEVSGGANTPSGSVLTVGCDSALAADRPFYGCIAQPTLWRTAKWTANFTPPTAPYTV